MRQSLVLVGLLAAAWFVAATTLIPIRVTLGGGSLRCGTVLQPETDSEIGDVCPTVAPYRLRHTWMTTPLFAAATSLVVLGGRLLARRRRVVVIGIGAVLVVAWFMVTGFLLLSITGAHSAPGS